MGFVAEFDAEEAQLAERPDEAYEVAIGIALIARQFAKEPSEVSVVAASLSLVFGTYVVRIHDNVTPRDRVIAAERDIAEAVKDWTGGGRDGLDAYAARWTSRVGDINTAWLDNPGEPLTRSPIRTFLDRFRRNKPHRQD